MEQLNFDYHALRARKARFGSRVTMLWRVVIALAGGVLVFAGVLLLMSNDSSGWFVGALASIPAFILLWHRKELSILPPGKTNDLVDILEADTLATLPKEPTPKDIVRAATTAISGQFFAARFGLAPNFLNDLSSDFVEDSAAIWKQAIRLQQKYHDTTLNGSAIVAAAVLSQPSIMAVLPHMQLDESDLEAGVGWYSRLNAMIKDQQRPRRTGGVARDWTFGYTPLLERFGVNWSERVSRQGLLHVRLDSHQNALKFMIDTFGTNGRQNVALIGPPGAGKSTLVQAFAEKLLSADSQLPSNLKFRQVVSLDASALISHARTRGELEGIVNDLLVEAFSAKNIILCLDDAQLFFEDSPGSVDLSSLLLPVLEGGGLRMILGMDEQRWLQIAQRNPSLASVLNRITVAEATQLETMLVLQDQLIQIEFSRHVTFMYQSLKEAYRLSQRYLHELAQPGKAVRLLESAAGMAENGLVTAESVQKAIEQSVGVKVSAPSGSSDDREKLLNLETLIHERMINQSRAVSVVSDALRRARAGVRNESRPIGTFLFLGPTGVGKTELSKSLAAVYFGGEDHLVRLDLNEFVRPEDVSRLIADGSSDPHSLTASIMKQPFSVVLLDEIEKAHPQVLTTLLQLLDEGVLRDINNREVSFRDAIIIATSNAGADRIRQLIDEGSQIETMEEQIVTELIDSQQFRPEFLNRFDEIVVFRPLTQAELLQVVDLIIGGINKTLAYQKITVVVEEAARIKLVGMGYDPRLGARPMRRVIQRNVESLIAKRLLDGSVQPGEVITITETDIIS